MRTGGAAPTRAFLQNKGVLRMKRRELFGTYAKAALASAIGGSWLSGTA
jgi:hypothetical protein